MSWRTSSRNSCKRAGLQADLAEVALYRPRSLSATAC